MPIVVNTDKSSPLSMKEMIEKNWNSQESLATVRLDLTVAQCLQDAWFHPDKQFRLTISVVEIFEKEKENKKVFKKVLFELVRESIPDLMRGLFEAASELEAWNGGPTHFCDSVVRKLAASRELGWSQEEVYGWFGMTPPVAKEVPEQFKNIEQEEVSVPISLPAPLLRRLPKA